MARKKRLLLARDRVGKKPLFYSWDGQRLVFGSEIKALFPAGGISKAMDLRGAVGLLLVPVRSGAEDHLPQRPQAAARRTIWSSMPAAFARCRTGTSASIRRASCPKSEWCEALLAEFRTAVKSRLVSDVPLGAFLSGGVDSSSVVALMNDFQPPVTTCSIGFSEDNYDEAEDAKRVRRRASSANHFEQIVEPRAIDLISKLAWHYDEPFGDSSAIPTYYVSQLARQHVTVALSGDGGDENFAGYRRYKLTMWEDQLRSRRARRRCAVRVFGPLGRALSEAGLGAADRSAARSRSRALRGRRSMAISHGISCCPPASQDAGCLNARRAAQRCNGYDSADVLRYHYDRADTDDPLSRIQYVDIKTYLVDDILTKVDRASMANSLEVRCPLLDHKLMELIAQIPSEPEAAPRRRASTSSRRRSSACCRATVLHSHEEGLLDAGGGVVPRRAEGLRARGDRRARRTTC